MSNQTLVAIPPNVADPEVLKVFLTRLLEQLDTVLGYRGDSEYLSAGQIDAAFTAIADQLAEVTELLTKTLADFEAGDTELQEELEDLSVAAAIKAWKLQFTGTAAVGPVAPIIGDNITALERLSPGLYQFTPAELTAEMLPVLSWEIAGGQYQVNYITSGSDIQLEVRTLAGALYDPTGASDVVNCVGLQ